MWVLGLLLLGGIAAATIWWTSRAVLRPDMWWWLRASAAGWRLTLGTVAMFVIQGVFLLTGPALPRRIGSFVVLSFIVAALLCWSTGSIANPRRKRAPWWIIGGWGLAGLIVGWVSGFGPAWLNDIGRYSQPGMDTYRAFMPLLRGLPFTVAVWALGLFHIRWLGRWRARNRKQVAMIELNRGLSA